MAVTTVLAVLAMIVAASAAFYLVSETQARAAELEARLAALDHQPLLPEPRDVHVRLAGAYEHVPFGLMLVGADETVHMHNTLAAELLGADLTGADHSLEAMAQSSDLLASIRQAVHQRRAAAGVIVPEPGRFVEVKAQPLHSGDTLVVVQDVSELRHLRTVRKDFVANVSHELRTPLASIRLLVDTLEAGALEDPDVSFSFVHRIGVEADQLIQMVNELLELARIETGQLPFQRERVPIGEIIEQAVARISVVSEDRGIAVTTELEEALPDVLVDRDQAVQVLLNLLFNAIKFTMAGGRVVVSAVARERFVEVSVRDTGVGIHQDDLGRIFERFYKSDKSRARSRGGTGLGLPIARHIIEAHGGNIWAESREGEGSTFTFTLPRA